MTKKRTLGALGVLLLVLSLLSLAATPADALGQGDQAAAAAESRIGRPFLWAGSGPYSFDCSGLTWWAYRKAGHSNLPRVSADQWDATIRVSRSNLRAGDLVFWSYSNRNGRGRASHVAMYVGNGWIVDARASRGGVVKYRLDEYTSSRIGYGRVPGINSFAATTSAPKPKPRPLREGEVAGDRGLRTAVQVRARIEAIREHRGLPPSRKSDTEWVLRIVDRQSHHLGDARIALTKRAEGTL